MTKTLTDYINKYITNGNTESRPILSNELQINTFNYIEELESTGTALNKAKSEALIILLNISRKHTLGCSHITLVTDETLVLKKLQQIKEASTIGDLNLIMGRPQVAESGGEVRAKHIWVLPEEEAMIWSETCLKAPLSDAGYKRYMMLFSELFPEEYKEAFAD